MGWLLYYSNKGAIILTDRRMLLRQIRGGSFTRVPKGDAKSNGVGREPAAHLR